MMGGVGVGEMDGAVPGDAVGEEETAVQVTARMPLKLLPKVPSARKMVPLRDTATPCTFWMCAVAVEPDVKPLSPVPATVETTHEPIVKRLTRAQPGSVKMMFPFASCARCVG